MILSDFLQEIAIKGWKLWFDNGRLRYRAPSNEETSTVLEQLKKYKTQIQKLLQEQPYLLEVYPLSQGQQALWFLWQLAPESSAYNVAFSCRICSDLDVAVLQKVFQVLSDRHPILRSTFPRLGIEPIQQINPEQPLDFQQIDVSNQSELKIQEQVFTAYKSPFDLERGPILRVRIFTLSPQEHILLIVNHHIVGEGWSIGILLDELKVLYPAFKTYREVTLPPAVHSYEYVHWQNTIINSPEGERLWDYWEQQLAGELPMLNLPTDRPRLSVQTYNGASCNLYISETLTKQLKELAKSEKTTLYIVLLAAFNVLLYRYTNQDDILIGSPTTSRQRSEFIRVVGYLINIVVLRANISGNFNFRDFLGQIRNTAIAAIAHQDYPFPLLVKRLQSHRDSSRSSIFQACFVLQKLQQTPDILKLYSTQIGSTVEWGGLVLEPYEVPQQEGQFDLDLELAEGDSSIFGAFKYNTDLFDGSTIERMAVHFQNLLMGIVENPQQAVGEIPMLNTEERHQLLVEWNHTVRAYPREKCIHQLFELQVERTPNAVAVVWENQQLTYRELNQRANQLGNYLKNLGVKPELLVGICMERSLEMIVGLLGILKAGGAYVPLDPNYPPERLAEMLNDSQASMLLTQQKLLQKLSDYTGLLIDLDSQWQVISQDGEQNIVSDVQADNLAYVIYTSGSTGKPKGVMISHRSLVNAYWGWEEAYQLSTHTSSHLQMASFSFDVFTGDMVRALCSGGKLVLCPRELLLMPEQLYQLMQTEKVDCGEFVPVVMRNLIGYLEKTGQNLELLKVLVVGSDSWYVQEYQQLQRLCQQNTRIINSYGTSETTIDSCYFESSAINLASDVLVPIGRPLSNIKIYILDGNLEPVPIGVHGELYIGGAGVARGYLNQPELTQAKFIPNPFSDVKSERLYKTGDLARYLADGNIEYLGRIDNQVKVRGFRIELGEIEAVLNTHPQIQQAVVMVTEDIYVHKRLVAYIAISDNFITSNQVREFLKQKLPDYMVPSAFVTLETLPLTPNGKIDKKALPTPDDIAPSTAYVAPTTEIEEIFTKIWQELLLKEKVSIHDNFFEIGGDSILSIQVVSRAKNLGIQITPKQIFQNQTIAELARVANTTVSVNAQQGIITGAAPLTPIQQWLFAQNKPEVHHYNQSVLLQIPNHLQSKLIEIALKKLVEHHDALRLRFRSFGSEYQQINQGLDEEVPFTVVDLSSIAKVSQPQALEKIATEYQASLNLSTGPIMQVVMFNLGSESDARLLIIIHHLAVDGVSWRILLSDLETIYQQLINQKPIKLGAKTTAFIDWAEKLKNYAQTEIVKQELNYWLNQPWSQTRPLPLDDVDMHLKNTEGSAATLSIKLNTEETETLLLSVNEAYNTQINDILLSALALVLTEWTENATVLINLEGHGREELFSDVDLSQTVGWFTSEFPVLLQIPKLDPIEKIIKSIKEQLRAIPNRGIGYGILRYLCADPDVNEKIKTIPASEINFNYLGQLDQVQSQTGWKFAPESTGANHSLKQTLDHLLDINALVVAGELKIEWTYSSHVHTQATVEKLAQRYLQFIRAIIEHCQLEENTGYTPSDFPDAKLNQLELDELLAPVKTQKIEAIYPLSPMQQGMLFHSLYAPESGVYFEQMTLSLQGNINITAFASAWQKIVDRYSILRTLFVWENRQTPLQVVLKQVELPWQNLDWRQLPLVEQEQQLSKLLSAEREQGFQFNQAPLMGCILIQLNGNSYKFIWNHHHILIDGWCLPIIFKDVLSFYETEITGKICNLPTPRPYRDYIAWLNSQDQEAAREFWRQTLDGLIAPTPLRVNKTPYQTQQTKSNYSEVELHLSAEVSGELQSIAKQHHVTLSTIVQAVWALLLSRYSGETDVVFGVTVSGRSGSLSGMENIVGLLINTLPLRLQISPQAQLIPWLQQIQQLMLELLDYSYTPLVDIQALSDVPGGIPLFESILVVENYPIDSSLLSEDSSLQISEIDGFERTNYPLTVVVIPGDELLVKISYDTARFEETTMRRMLGHLQTIFSAIVENPSTTVGELPLLSAAERHQLLVEWNDTASEYAIDKCIHQLFESQVEKTPDAVAVVFENQQLTYRELNQKANQLAHHLQTLGVKPEFLVGICVERSLEMVVGLLGILKAGGAYLPLDPHYPPERLSYMLADAGVEILLTQQDLLSSLSSHPARVICLDTDWPTIAQHSHENLDVAVCADNLVYVIYTSGSTGQPKGVAIEHLSLCNLAQAQTSLFNVKATSRVLQFASLSFDASVSEIFMAVTSGAMLILATASKLMPGDDLQQILDNYSITHLTLPPSALAVLPTHEFPALGQIIVAGEACPLELVNQWSVGRRFFNAYGPTESTVCATVAPISHGSEKITIGRPINNTQIYILDSNHQPVPIGVPGELYIGGDGLARGYLNRPELTQEKFIPHPCGERKSQRLYKTGDLARYLSDGNIEFLGRIDNQVKIRGFRIELGEIEAILNTHPQIQQAVVIATAEIAGNKRLVAYIVTTNGTLITNELRDLLKSKLPEYMVPSIFVTLNTLPLTPNGKIDKKALPIPDGEITREHEYTAPSTAIEQILTNIWQELLLKEKVSIHDNFFEIGGDSILSIQVVSRAKNLGIQITPKQIFDNQTIAELARVANTTVGIIAKQGIVTGVAPLTPIQHWLFAQNRQEVHHYNQSVLLQVPNDLQSQLIAIAVKKLLEHHDALRLRFTLVGSEYQQINQGLDAGVPFTVVDLSSVSKVSQPQALEKIAAEYQASLNLSTGPIMQVVMFNLGSESDARLLIIIHHLAVDGVSWRILLSDLEAIYRQLINQKPIELSPKTTAFIDWAEKLKNYAQTEIIKQELDYWIEQPWSKRASLPLDYVDIQQENIVGSTEVVSMTLSAEETKALLLSVNEAYNTQINDILLSALVQILAEWTGNSTVLINLEGHGREELFSDVDLSRTVGWFTSTFPVLLQLPKLDKPEKVIKSIKEQLRAIPNRGIGYGILRYLCDDPRVQEKIQMIPSSEISFNYLGQFGQIQSQSNWKFTPKSSGNEHSLKQTRNDILDVNALVIEGELQIDWTYSHHFHTRTTVEKLARNYIQIIRSIIEHCQLEDTKGYTPSDFPDVQLNQLELDQLLTSIKHGKHNL
ncbi:amino acid adenylation domain-containing protein (plasmid) [Cylindrospermum sp. NIES-4074]|nr:amino acid adenylation domain-containing protein [Cylindrospermum sp. NIES-4074]